MKPIPLLLPFSWLFGAGVAARNLFYDIGLFRTTSLPVPIISVGNISAGGTGKTPFVALLANMAKQRGRKVAVVSRGYGRKSKGYVVVSNGYQRCAEAFHAGDEPALLAENLHGVVIVVDDRKARGASRVLKDFKVDTIILDDGFQHRFLSRMHDIVLMTAQEILKPTPLLPAGYRREPFSSLRRADVIVITKCRDRDQFDEVAGKLRKWDKPIAGVQSKITGFTEAFSGETRRGEWLRGKEVVAFSGIADPQSFEETLSSAGARVERHLRFPDHHWYTEEDLRAIARAIEEKGATVAVTTEKDAVRLRGMGESAMQILSKVPVVVAMLELSIMTGTEAVEKVLVSL